MFNYIKADFFRLSSRVSMWIWSLLFLVLPSVIVVSVGKNYGLEQILKFSPTILYIAFMIFSLVLVESVFREDKDLNLFKNDTTSGISKSKIFVSKYLTSMLIEMFIWILSLSLLAITNSLVFGAYNLEHCFTSLFNATTIYYIISSFIFLIVFQIVSIYVKKTSMIILICALLSTALTSIKDLLIEVLPSFKGVIELLFFSGSSTLPTTKEVTIALLISTILITFLVSIGSKLFKNQEF